MQRNKAFLISEYLVQTKKKWFNKKYSFVTDIIMIAQKSDFRVMEQYLETKLAGD
jgi:hypothetical protein